MITKGFWWPALRVLPRVSGGLLGGGSFTTQRVSNRVFGSSFSVGQFGGDISSMMSRAFGWEHVRALKNFGSVSGGISTTSMRIRRRFVVFGGMEFFFFFDFLLFFKG
jgi:hypothetical protein